MTNVIASPLRPRDNELLNNRVADWANRHLRTI